MYLVAVIYNSMTRFFEARSHNHLSLITIAHMDGFRETKVIYVDAAQRGLGAPKQKELFELLVSRAKPIDSKRYSSDWYNCNAAGARKLLLNVLENPEAKVETFAVDAELGFLWHIVKYKAENDHVVVWWPDDGPAAMVSYTDPIVGKAYWNVIHDFYDAKEREVVTMMNDFETGRSTVDPARTRWRNVIEIIRRNGEWDERAGPIVAVLTVDEWDQLLVDAYVAAVKAYRQHPVELRAKIDADLAERRSLVLGSKPR